MSLANFVFCLELLNSSGDLYDTFYFVNNVKRIFEGANKLTKITWKISLNIVPTALVIILNLLKRR